MSEPVLSHCQVVFTSRYMSTILGLREDNLRYFHDKCFPTLRSKTKMNKKYYETKTLFKEVTNLPLEVRTCFC